jgi:DNA-nicking Smr family endonuclease
MNDSFELKPEDRNLFRQHLGGVTPLLHDRAEPPGLSPAPVPRLTRADERQVLQDMVSDYFEPAEIETGEELQYCSEGLQQSVLRKLRRGQFRFSAVLDLHGLTAAGAHQVLTEFLCMARRESLTCVRIIHGKGNGSRHRGPVLKTKVNQWLRQRAEVLAFCSARPVDGGTGAVYVLLRRRG